MMSIVEYQRHSANDIYRHIGKRIQAERLALGFSQDDLAKVIDLERTSVTNLEAGRQRLPIHKLYQIADMLGISVFSLMPPNDAMGIGKETNHDYTVLRAR
jgi:transcriptional regulator with XRE-family HTH domain